MDIDDAPPIYGAEELERTLGHVFRRPELLDAALTHRSYSNEAGGGPNYERLEFLGDSVVGLIAAHWLYEQYPESPEGELAKLKSFLVSTSSLSRRAEDLGAGRLLLLGVGEERSGGSGKPSLLADVLEALVGAVFLDAGLDAARAVMVPLFEKSLTERSHKIPNDTKTYLQEIVQARGWKLPEYRLTDETGPDHCKEFHVECWIRGALMGAGEGHSKKRAEQAAAAEALEKLETSSEE